MNDPTLIVPVSLLLKLYKKTDDSTRKLLEDYIRDYKQTVDHKGHVAEGFRKNDDGDLVFDFPLYDEAVYRGKVNTYTKSVKEELEKLKGTLTMLQSMSETQQELISAITTNQLAQRIGLGKPISDEELQLLGRLQPLLKKDPDA